MPVVFRLNKSCSNFDAVKSKFGDIEYFRRNFFDVDDSDYKDLLAAKGNMNKHNVDYTKLALTKIDWFPEGVAYKMNVTRDTIRKNPGLKKLQKFINACSEAGLLTRQELVSMLPPLFLDVQPTDMILDMCAAPGSKTSQMIEEQLSNYHGDLVRQKGGVIANDADNKRAFMLTHQLQRIDTCGMCVINHEGQYIPNIKRKGAGEGVDSKYYFDKILADVPCSGDGAIRKIPQKWRGWNSRDGCGLHTIQIQILERSVQLVKEGGLVLYSTCSLNPIENEAVVSDVLDRANKESPGSLELVDIHHKFEGVIGHHGMDQWDILVEKNEMKDKKSDDSSKYTAEELFHILKSYNAQQSEQLNSMLKRRKG